MTDSVEHPFSTASLYKAWESDPAWQKFIAQQARFDRPNTFAVNELMRKAAPEIRGEFLKRLGPANKSNSAVDFERHALGVAFTLQRLTRMMERRKDEMALTDEPLEIKEGFYTAYNDDDTPPQRKTIHIQDHFTLYRDGRPFIYKAKYTPVRQYGKIDPEQKDPHSDYNQLLKYNAAIDNGMISGAAIEIRGLIDPAFLSWACGTSVFERSNIPHVQLIYNLPLPSGQEYRFTLKKPESYDEDFNPHNDRDKFTAEDMQIVEGIENALRSQDQLQLIEILSGQTVFTQKGTLNRMFNRLTCPLHESELQDPEFYDSYLKMMQSGIWERAARITPQTYNHDADTVFSMENIGIEDDLQALRERVEAHQAEMREQSKDLAVNSNSLGDDPESPEYKALVEEVVAEFSANIARIRHANNIRVTEEQDDPLIVGRRKHKGWVGPDDGYKLDLYIIMMDSVAIVKSRHDPKKIERSYDHSAQRFMNIDDLLNLLDERKDSSYKIMTLFDPSKEGKNRRRVIENISPDRIQGEEIKLARHNNKVIQKLLADAADGKVKLSRNEKSRYKRRKNDILLMQSRIAQNNADKAAQSQAISKAARKEGLKKLPEDHPEMLRMQELQAQVHDLQLELWNTFDGLLDTSHQQSLTQCMFVQEKNIIKIIYAIDHRGRMLFEEEHTNTTGRANRASHSELLGGANVFGAGEIIFTKAEGSQNWQCVEINNGSGHYLPPPQTLRYAANMMIETLEGAYRRRGLRGAEIQNNIRKMLVKARLTDALARGIALRNEELDIRRHLTDSQKLAERPFSRHSSKRSPK